MKQTIYLKGTITTDTPYATSPEGCRGRNDEQLLPKLPVNIGGAIKMQPYIPAAGLKGKLRRAAAHVILDRFIDAGKTLTFEDWLLLACGGVKGSEREDIDPRDRARIIDQSALLSLFGAGASPAGGMVGAKLHMFPALPQGDVETAFVKGTRAHEDKRPVLGEILPRQSPVARLQLRAGSVVAITSTMIASSMSSPTCATTVRPKLLCSSKGGSTPAQRPSWRQKRITA